MTFIRRFDVRLHGRVIGGIFARGRTVAFAFDDDYRDDPTRAVLGLRFEEVVDRTIYADSRMPPWFANLLPEGQLRVLLEASVGVGPQQGSLFEREAALFDVVGHDLPGAVEVMRPGGSSRGADRIAPPREDMRGAEYEKDALLRFSVAGVGLKLSALRDGRAFTLPARGRRGEWLVKLPDRTFRDLPLNEYAMMRLAAAAGMAVPEVDLVHRDDVQATPDTYWSGEDRAFVIRRFDRGPGGVSTHIEDLAQVRGLPPERKYEGNFETVANLLFRGRDAAALEEFVRRLAFNLLIGNSDAHLKNWSIAYLDRRTPSLTPAYDLVSVIAYAEQGVDTNLPLRLANRRRFADISLEDFARLERKIGATGSGLAEIAAVTIERTLDAYPVAAEILSDRPDLEARIRAHVAAMARHLLGRQW